MKTLSLRAAGTTWTAPWAWWTAAAGVGEIGRERLVFLDECGVLTTLSRLRGRSPRGDARVCLGTVRALTRLTVLGALGAKGIVGAMSVEAATSAAVFHAYLEQVLLPELRRTKPDAVLIMDNLPAHKASRVRTLLETAQALLTRLLPAYSPDLNPIEPGWAKIKTELRSALARAHRGRAARRPAARRWPSITAQDAAGFFRHCGYSLFGQNV